jgi:SAM-dependent methyltransferase
VRRIVATRTQLSYSASEYAWDRRRGVDTRGIVPEIRYMAVQPRAFREFLGHLPADRSELTLLDVGSGRGRALLLAVEHGFGHAVGVEHDAELHRVACANVARRGLGDRITLLHGDARELLLPPGPLVLFIYNPCPREVLEPILERIRALLRADPRPAWLVYEATEDRDLLDGAEELELVAERRERAGANPRRPRFAIYRTG